MSEVCRNSLKIFAKFYSREQIERETRYKTLQKSSVLFIFNFLAQMSEHSDAPLEVNDLEDSLLDECLGQHTPRRKRNSSWSHSQTLLLIEAYKLFDFQYGVMKDSRKVWKLPAKFDKISSILKDLGAERSGKECQNKWHNLYHQWKAIKDFNAQ